MDFRYFNEDTQQWEKSVAQGEDFDELTDLVDSKLVNIENGANVYERFQPHCKMINDWNDVYHNGFYMGNNALNGPNADWIYGEMIVHDDLWATQNVKSTGANIGDTNEYTRDKRAGVWGDWVQRKVALGSIVDQVYEVGQFTPYIENASNTVYGSRNGIYTRIGNLISVSFFLTVSTIDPNHVNVSPFKISGLPYASNSRHGVSIGYMGGVHYNQVSDITATLDGSSMFFYTKDSYLEGGTIEDGFNMSASIVYSI